MSSYLRRFRDKLQGGGEAGLLVALWADPLLQLRVVEEPTEANRPGKSINLQTVLIRLWSFSFILTQSSLPISDSI